jgi:sialate O-acetylesterase
MRSITSIMLLTLALAGCQKGPSMLKLPSLIGDNMVLQQKTDVQIWGEAARGQKILIAPDWGAEIKTIAGENGKWLVSIPVLQAGGPHSMTITAVDTAISIHNIMFGEVWFCSGQSNMEMPMAGWPPVDTIMYSTRTIASASIPEIRLFNVQRKVSGEPLDDFTGKWEVCTPATVRQFSATAFFFGSRLNRELKVPVGLIESAWGGTPSESWTSSDALEEAGEFVTEIKAIKESAPLQAGYQSWLNEHRKIDIKPAGDDQWKDLSFNDETVPSPDFDDTAWPVMNLPGLFEKNLGEFDGAVWFRKKIEIPADFSGKDLELSLGPVDDMDCTWFNGEPVGSTDVGGRWQVNRTYTVPGNLVRNGINIIAVRVLDTQGGGGIYGQPGSMNIALKGETKAPLSIEGEWKYQPVAELIGSKFYILDLAKNEFFNHKRPQSLGPYTPSTLYNSMVNPAVKYNIKGAIWYQGEANVGRAAQYSKIFPLMIENWRNSWGIEDFPFYFVQIAPYVYSNPDSVESALLREAQTSALKLPKTGMVVTLDIATVKNIHPPFKKEVGERLANLALAKDYGISIPVSGPVYKSMVRKGAGIMIQFDNTGKGLVTNNTDIPEFEISGSDGKFIRAKAVLVNNEVEVSSPKVKDPEAVRYCWRNGAVGTLFNSDGLPATQFTAKK